MIVRTCAADPVTGGTDGTALFAGLAAGGLLPPAAQVVVGTGFLGGYTTFSTAAVEAVRLALGGHRRAAVLHAAGQLAAGVLLAGCGLLAGLALG